MAVKRTPVPAGQLAAFATQSSVIVDRYRFRFRRDFDEWHTRDLAGHIKGTA